MTAASLPPADERERGTDHTGTAVYSIDGTTFAFRAVVASSPRPGAYVTIRSAEGDMLGQILDTAAVPGTTFGEPWVEGTGTLLVEKATPFTNATMHPADTSSAAARLAGGPGTTLEIGSLIDVEGAPAVFRASGLTRHTFVCGQSGSGKTYAMGKILERILLDTDLRVVIMDPNSDYVNLGTLLDRAETGLDEIDYEAARKRHQEYASEIHVLGSDRGGLRGWLGNLDVRQQAIILGLDPIADAEEVDLARSIVQGFESTRYTPSDLKDRLAGMSGDTARRLSLRIGNLGLDRMDIWADADHPAIVDRMGENWRVAVFDLGSLRTPVERSMISAAVVGALWERRLDRRPVLLVVDEAHHLCPQEATDANQALAREHLIAIAGEGRKYGIYLMLATQRPTKLHENAVSQCDNLILMRMNSAGDIAHLSSTFSAIPPSLIGRSATFGLGEGLAWGRIAPDPLLFKTGRRMTREGGSDVPANWLR